MRRFLLLFMLIFVSTYLATAQENTIYIEITRDGMPDTAINIYLRVFQKRLEEENISPIFIEQNEIEDYPFFWELDSAHLIFVSRAGSEETGVLFTPYINMNLPISPYLDATYDSSTGVLFEEDFAESMTFSVGLALYATHNCSASLPYLQESLAIENGSTFFAEAIHFYLGNCALLSGEIEAAQEHFEQSLPPSYFEENTYILTSTPMNLAWTYVQQGNSEKAIEIISLPVERSEALENDFELRLALSRQSRINALLANYTKAIADMDDAINACLTGYYPSVCAEPYVERGQRYVLVYEWDNALADYNRALELDPTYPDAYYFRGVLYASVPEGVDARQAALDDFERYLEILPQGNHADDAARYGEEIQAQLDTLSSP